MRIMCFPASLPRSEQIMMSLVLDLELGMQAWCVTVKSGLLCEEIELCKH